jgi:regulator of protease activity HflC (stomatin/prohibitin superfamily)
LVPFHGGFHDRHRSLLILVVLFLMTSLRVLNEYERGVIFRLGGSSAQGTGLIILLRFLTA